jgi:hypothetical protein
MIPTVGDYCVMLLKNVVPNYILTIEAIKSVAGNEEEYNYTLNEMLPKMLVGGFVTVTITSVIIAGYFVKLL